jgi:hypothetical protein
VKKLVASVVLTASLSLMLLVPADAHGTATGPYSTYDARTGYGANGTVNGTTGTFRTNGTATAPGMTTFDTTRANNVRTRAAAGADNDIDWGWLGLLGLIGLAGLRGRNRERT